MTLKAKKRPHLHDTSQTVHSSEKTMILQYLILLWYSIIFGKYKHNGWNSAFGNKKSTQSTPHSWYAITETSYICFDMRAFRVKKEMKQTENHHTSHHNLRIFLVFSSVQVRRNLLNMSGRSCYKGFTLYFSAWDKPCSWRIHLAV